MFTHSRQIFLNFFNFFKNPPLLKWFKNAVNRELQREIENLNNRVFFKEKHLKEIKNCCIKLFFYDVFIRDLRHIYKKKISIKWGWYCWLKCFDFDFFLKIYYIRYVNDGCNQNLFFIGFLFGGKWLVRFFFELFWRFVLVGFIFIDSKGCCWNFLLIYWANISNGSYFDHLNHLFFKWCTFIVIKRCIHSKRLYFLTIIGSLIIFLITSNFLITDFSKFS